jgi:hypothetical protein
MGIRKYIEFDSTSVHGQSSIQLDRFGWYQQVKAGNYLAKVCSMLIIAVISDQHMTVIIEKNSTLGKRI